MAQMGNEAYGPYQACVGSSFTNSEGGSEGISFVRPPCTVKSEDLHVLEPLIQDPGQSGPLRNTRR